MTPRHRPDKWGRLSIALAFPNNFKSNPINYPETLEWLFNRLPMYQRVGDLAYKKDLDNTRALADHLNNPENGFPSIHVAGTNGKGSVSHMIASVLQEAGYKTGLYTSPHLKDFRERIKINGTLIPESEVTSFVKEHRLFFEEHSLSFFEMTVGLAFYYFNKEKVDVAVIEVGMGGRLDSTNIITPELSVITNIGKDHTRFLGDTLALIAGEKAGIIKHKVPVVIGETQPETKPVFEAKAKEQQSEIIFADALPKEDYETDLKGNYQEKNKQTAVIALKTLKSRSTFSFSNGNLLTGMKNVVKNTGLQGRWQVLQKKPKVICDTAHNTEGLTYVFRQLKEEQYKNLHIVFGAVADKELALVIKLLPREASYYFCRPDIPRGLEAESIRDLAAAAGISGMAYSSVEEAYGAALKNAGKDDLIFIGGSTFVVAEII